MRVAQLRAALEEVHERLMQDYPLPPANSGGGEEKEAPVGVEEQEQIRQLQVRVGRLEAAQMGRALGSGGVRMPAAQKTDKTLRVRVEIALANGDPDVRALAEAVLEQGKEIEELQRRVGDDGK